MVRAEDYSEIPDNRHGIAAGTVLLATDTSITLGGGTSRDFVRQQGGDEDTFIFIFGMRRATSPLGFDVEFVEGVFLSAGGQGFKPTWGYEQLLREVDLGGWTVVPTAEVLGSWTGRIEERMNRG